MREKNFTLPEWLEHIQTQHWRSVDLTLERVAQVWKNLRGTRSGLVITIAGTNGKGSCVAMLDAVLRESGMKVGSYTSPHLRCYNERVQVDGDAVDDATLCRAFVEIERARGDIPLTYFEFGTLCALWVFAQRRVEVSILEVGMGGRLDAVNIIDNDIALITSLGIDHARWLGSDRDSIAAEKAGVLKHDALAVCADSKPPPSIAAIADERECVLVQSQRDYQMEAGDDAYNMSANMSANANTSMNTITWHSNHAAIPSAWQHLADVPQPLNGAQQQHNLGGVIAVLALTCERTGVTPQHLRDGLAKTRLSARCQVLARAPEIILDVAHNLDSATDLATFLAQRHCTGKTHAVFGMLADKPVGEIAALLDDAIDCWYLATLPGERGQTAESLKEQLAEGKHAPAATLHTSPVAAYLAAVGDANRHDRVVVFGSFCTVGDIITHYEHDDDWVMGDCLTP